MYTVYLIFTLMLIVSFVTGNVVLLVEHKQKKSNVLTIEKGSIIDREIL